MKLIQIKPLLKFLKLIDLNLKAILTDSSYFRQQSIENSLIVDYVDVILESKLFSLPIYSTEDRELTIEEKVELLTKELSDVVEFEEF